jgi:hypothetical protein
MNATASIAKNEIPVRVTQFERWVIITFDVPNGWDDVAKVCKKVLIHGGEKFTFTGWNSDRNECFFKRVIGEPVLTATFVK